MWWNNGLDFLDDYDSDAYSIAELCRKYEISRPTGYKLLKRREQEGAAGLPRWQEEIILELRRKHPRWGPKKLLWRLERDYPAIGWPVVSTIGDLLHREGLTIPRRKRRRTPPYTEPFVAAQRPNLVWCMDFKGHFRTGDGERIDPFTLNDAYSRYLLRCQAVDHTDTEQVLAVLEAAFREYGLPDAIRSDNGPPFATRAVAGLSRLSVYLIKLGIIPERIQPGHPEQNGRLERLHRTLKAETASPPAATRRGQQRAFDRFRREYNQERPHEALGQCTPASCYSVSVRAYPARVPEPEYGSSMHVRRVAVRGQFRWKAHHIFLTESLVGEVVGLEQIDDRYYTVYFAHLAIAIFDSYQLRTQPLQRKEKTFPSGNDGTRKRAGSNNANSNPQRSFPRPLEIPQTTRDSHIPSATAATIYRFSRKNQNLNPGLEMCQLCPRSKVSTLSPVAQSAARKQGRRRRDLVMIPSRLAFC